MHPTRSNHVRPGRLSLIGLNLLLLGALAWVTFQPAAGAESAARPGQPARPRGQYVLNAGRMQGSTVHAVYVLDVVNQELLALRWDRAGQRLEVLGYRNLSQDGAGPSSR